MPPVAGDAPASIVVIKVGTSSILQSDGRHLALSTLAALVESIVALRAAGLGVVLVSSGAVGVGCQTLGVTTRPKELAELQAMAAVGQPRLMAHYESLFSALGQPIAQVLLSADALGSRTGYLNAQATFAQLLRLGVVPIVNENDSVAISELKFGDNDTLSALVGTMVGARWLFLATDVDALYTSNPTAPPKPGEPPAEPIREVADVAAAMRKVEAAGSNSGSQWGTGGIYTKLRAAQLAGAAGCVTCIVHAKRPQDIDAVCLGGAADVGTRFLPKAKATRSHKRWILGLPVRGSLSVDAGAARAVLEGSSLFARGVKAVAGDFGASDAVQVLDAASGAELARGVTNYSASQARSVLGKHSAEYEGCLGWNGPEEVVHRHNLVLLSDPAATAEEGAPAPAAPVDAE